MSILNAKPFINEVLKSCSEAELDTLLTCINGQGPKAVFRTLKPYAEDRLTEADKGVKPIVLELPDSRAQTVYNGYLIYTNEHCVALTYGNNKEQNLLIINIDNGNGNYEILNGDLSITELRSELFDISSESVHDEIVYGYLFEGAFYEDAEHTVEIEPSTERVYIDVPTNVTYRWTGTEYVQIGFAGMVNPMTAANDIIIGGTDGEPTRLAVGTAGQVLTVNSGATGVEWATPSGGGSGYTLTLTNDDNQDARIYYANGTSQLISQGGTFNNVVAIELALNIIKTTYNGLIAQINPITPPINTTIYAFYGNCKMKITGGSN